MHANLCKQFSVTAEIEMIGSQVKVPKSNEDESIDSSLLICYFW